MEKAMRRTMAIFDRPEIPKVKGKSLLFKDLLLVKASHGPKKNYKSKGKSSADR